MAMRMLHAPWEPSFLSRRSDHIRWSGCWEQRPGRIICRWMLSWAGSGSTYGAIGGYSGGGSFQLEKFHISECGAPLIEASENFSEIIPTNLINICENCIDIILNFHYRQPWLNADTLYLKKAKINSLRSDGDLLFGGSDINFNCGPLLESVGIITRPHKP